jgi:hypothetical protein
VTKFHGQITARGGSEGGDGGFVETSGRMHLESYGSVDASAPLGAGGEWLLDPYNVTIFGATANGSFDSGSPNVFTATGTATANVTTIVNSLDAGTSVTITTSGEGGDIDDLFFQPAGFAMFQL